MVKRLIKSSPFWSIVLFVGMCVAAYVGTTMLGSKVSRAQGYVLPPTNRPPLDMAFSAACSEPMDTCFNDSAALYEMGENGNQPLPCSVTGGPSGPSGPGCSSCSGPGTGPRSGPGIGSGTGPGTGPDPARGIGGTATTTSFTNAPGRDPERVATSGSMISNLTFNYVHYAWDYRPPTVTSPLSEVQLVRYYRTRDVGWWGSFGPGGFCNYDIKLTSLVHNPATGTTSTSDVDAGGWQHVYWLFDPTAEHPVKWSEGVTWLDENHAPLEITESVPPELKYVVLTSYYGTTFSFEVFQAGTGQELEGRLIRMQDSRGYGTTITYKTWTALEISASPERQWQIDEVQGDDGNVLSFEYGSTMVGGRWAVSSITFPNGESADYSYSGGHLSQVDHSDGTTSTFTGGNYSLDYLDSDTELYEMVINDPAADPVHRSKKVYMSHPFFIKNMVLYNQASQLVQVVANASGETAYFTFSPGAPAAGAYDGSSVMSYEGGGKVKVTGFSGVAHYEAKFKAVDGHVSLDSYTFLGQSNRIGGGQPYTINEDNGVTRSYMFEYGNWVQEAGSSDSTAEKYCFGAMHRVTRYRDRMGRVTRMTYDPQGNMLTKGEGVRETTGYLNWCGSGDFQSVDYALTSYEYYGAMDANKYLLKKVTDPNGNITNYEYDSNHRVTKVIQPPDVAMGTRAEIGYAYDMIGRLQTVTAPDGSETSYEYDERNRLTKTTFEDGTTERSIYGTGANAGLLMKTVDRRGAVTDYAYDLSGRLIKITTGEKTMNAGGTETALSPSLKVEEIRTYLEGTDLVETVVRAGEKTEYVYDARHRVIETRVTANTGKTLVTKNTYVSNKLFSTEDPYGRKTFYNYNASDARMIRTIQATVPSVTYANFAAVAAASRPAENAANPTVLITDYQYNAEGDVLKVTDPRGYEHTTTYDYRGRAVAQVKASGTAVAARTETVYDDANNVVEVRTPRYFDSGDTNGFNQAKTTMTYTGRNKLKARIEAPGTAVEGTETLSYDLMGRTVSKVDMRGKAWSTAYPTCCGRTTTSTDPLGHGTIAHTNANGQVTHVIAVSDISSHMSLHNPTDNKTHREVTTKYDLRGRKVAETVWLTPLGLVDPDDPPIYTGIPVNDSATPPMVSTYGLTTTWTYDDDLDDGSGLDSTFSAHVAGLLLGASCDGSAVLTIAPSGERVLTVRDGAGRTVRNVQVDGNGDTLVSKTIARDAVASISGYGNVLETTSTNQVGHITKTRTDGAGRTIESVDGAGKVTKVAYNPGGNRLSVRDPNNVGQDCVYDALGRDTQCTDTASNVTSQTYDLEGNVLTQTDAKSHASSFVYDARGRRTKLTDRLGGETEWTYDLSSNELSMTDAEEKTTSYEYDDLGRRIKTTWPDHVAMSTVGASGYGITEVVYTPISQMLRTTDQLGDTITSVYDLAGRLKQREARTKVNSPSGTIAFTDSFTYDAGSRMLTAVSGQYTNTVTRTYSEGRLASEGLTISGQTYTTGVVYDFSVPKITLTYPDGSTVERTQNSRGLLNTLKLGSTTILSRVYDDGGRQTQQTFGNGIVEDFGYVTNDNLPATRETGVGDFSFTWDVNKNKTSESVAGALSGYGWSTGMSGFDNGDRLVTRNQGSSGTQLNESWDLSLVGDMSSTTTNGTSTNRTHGNAHELTGIGATSIVSDLKGNVLNDTDGRTFQWDWNNQMKSADLNADTTPDVTFTYDALRRRTSKTVNSTTAVFASLGYDSVADYASGAAANSPLRNYVSTGRIDEPVVMVDKTAAGAIGAGTAELFYYHHDANWHVRGLTNASGAVQELYAYSSYGTPTFLDSSGSVITSMSVPVASSSLGNRFLFTSREWDSETRTHFFRNRVASSAQARFMNRDPLAYPNGTNLYSAYFVPFTTDPSGLDYHHWFAQLGGRGQALIDQKCKTTKIDIDRYTTWYDGKNTPAGFTNETPHGYLHHTLKYDEIYEAMICSTENCCQALVVTMALMRINHELLQMKKKKSGFGDSKQPLDFIPTRELYPYGRRGENTSIEFWGKVADACYPGEKNPYPIITQKLNQVEEELRKDYSTTWTEIVNPDIPLGTMALSLAADIVTGISIAEDFATGGIGVLDDVITVVPAQGAKCAARQAAISAARSACQRRLKETIGNAFKQAL